MSRGKQLGISELPCASVSNRVLVQNLLYENEFDLHENEPVGGTDLSYQWFHTDTRFNMESKGNLEKALTEMEISLISTRN